MGPEREYVKTILTYLPFSRRLNKDALAIPFIRACYVSGSSFGCSYRHSGSDLVVIYVILLIILSTYMNNSKPRLQNGWGAATLDKNDPLILSKWGIRAHRIGRIALLPALISGQ